MRHNQSAIIGQLTYQENHLVHVYISNIEIQITPIQNSLFNSRHDYRIIYQLNNSQYYYDQIMNKYSWKNLSVRTIIGNSLRGYKQYSMYFIYTNFQDCTAELQLVFRIDVPNLVVMTKFDSICPMTQDRIKLFTYSDEALKIQTISFAILTSIVCLIQIFNAIKLIKMQPDENSLNSNTLSFVLIQDVVMCLFSALLFDLYSSWMYILIPCIIFQLIVIILDLQINLLSQQETELNSHRVFKGGIIAFIQLLIITYLLYHIRKSTSLIILNLFLVPQIIETYLKGRRRTFNKTYIFGFLMPRTVIAIYLRGSTLNWLQLKVKYHVVFAVIIVVIIQIAIYYVQCRYGYFLRKIKGHNYFAQASITTLNCAICLNAVQEQQSSQIEEQDPHIKSALEEAQEMNLIMITPCSHQFHPTCLNTWMQINSTCPLCKQQLPQII
ncbi:hypothetical protein pb186bvf_003800 [Paramecium bursaria]